MTGKGETLHVHVATSFSLPLPFREMAVKFNDYFEFPKEFDLLPYTAAGLAQIEGNLKHRSCLSYFSLLPPSLPPSLPLSPLSLPLNRREDTIHHNK